MGTFSSTQGWLTFAAVFGALAFIDLVGRAVARDPAVAALSLPAGWGIASLAMTLPGVLLGIPLYDPVIALALFAAWTGYRGASYSTGCGLLKILVVAIGFVVIVAAMREHPVDDFTYWLPNALYLHDHNIFPTNSIQSLSHYPGFPQNLQLISYIATLPWPYFPSTALIATNVLLLLWFAGLLATAASGRSDFSWQIAAFAFLLATLLNPTFVPGLALSAMGDLPSGILLAAAAYGGVQILQKKRRNEAIPSAAFLTLGLTLSALINIKESTPALVGIFLIAYAAVALLDANTRRPWPARHLLAIILPPALVYAAWRYELSVPLAGATVHELLPISQWQYWNIPAILRQMTYVAGLKGGFFGVVLLLIIYALWALFRRRQDAGSKLALIVAITFIGNTAFLVLVYIGLFVGQNGLDVQSFWRFNTQLGPLALLAATEIVAPYWRQRAIGALPRSGAAALIVICLGAPFLFLPSLRVDRHGAQPRIWSIGRDLKKILPPHAHADIVIPDDNGDISELMNAVLTQIHPRRTDLTLTSQATLQDLPQSDFIWLSCASEESNHLLRIRANTGDALLLHQRAANWHIIHAWSDGACVGEAKRARKRGLLGCIAKTLNIPMPPPAPGSTALLKSESGDGRYDFAHLWCKVRTYY